MQPPSCADKGGSGQGRDASDEALQETLAKEPRLKRSNMPKRRSNLHRGSLNRTGYGATEDAGKRHSLHPFTVSL